MGFFSLLGEVAGSALKGMVENGKKIQNTRNEYQGYSDDRLKDIERSSSSSWQERGVAHKILKERNNGNNRDN